MHARQGEFGALFLHPVLAGNGVHPQAPFDHQFLANLNTVLQVLGEVAPTHHLELAWRIINTQAVKSNGHFSDWRLVVLGVAEGWGFQDLHFQHAVIQAANGSSAPS